MKNFEKLINETLVFIAQKGWALNSNAFFDSLALFLSNKLGVDYVIIDKYNLDKNTAETLTFVALGKVETNVTYSLKDTPCENVMGKNLCCYAKDVQKLFPNDTMLVNMKAESYIGIPLWDSKGNANGLIALLHTKAIKKAGEIEKILQIVAVRAAHEVERNNYENELVENYKKLEDANRLKTAFLQNMSHEIRTPMNAIMGFAELLPNNFDNKVKLKVHSQIIQQRCSDLLDIINDILDVAKIESGQLPVNFEDFNISVLFTELKDYFAERQLRYGKQHIELNFITDKELESITIYTDKVKLRQILINLISNSFKFSDKGKIEVSCSLNELSQLEFHVSDEGIGIPQDKHELIFERFAQVEINISRKYGGTGLGLSIVKGLTNLLGGNVWLKSEPGLGSSFYFTIANNTKPLINKIFEEEVVNNNTMPKNKTILIVEDDFSNSELIREILSAFDFKMLFAEDGANAIKLANEANPDLILMDIRLPDMKGYDAIKQILQFNPCLKIIAQTAYAASEDKYEAIACGCVDYISKPLNSQLLQTMVNKFI